MRASDIVLSLTCEARTLLKTLRHAPVDVFWLHGAPFELMQLGLIRQTFAKLNGYTLSLTAEGRDVAESVQ